MITHLSITENEKLEDKCFYLSQDSWWITTDFFFSLHIYNFVKGLKQERGTKRKGLWICMPRQTPSIILPREGWKDDTQRHTKDPTMYAILGIVCTRQHSAAIIRGSPCVMSIESTDSWQRIRIFGLDKLLLTFRICGEDSSMAVCFCVLFAYNSQPFYWLNT